MGPHTCYRLCRGQRLPPLPLSTWSHLHACRGHCQAYINTHRQTNKSFTLLKQHKKNEIVKRTHSLHFSTYNKHIRKRQTKQLFTLLKKQTRIPIIPINPMIPMNPMSPMNPTNFIYIWLHMEPHTCFRLCRGQRLPPPLVHIYE